MLGESYRYKAKLVDRQNFCQKYIDYLVLTIWIRTHRLFATITFEFY